jgi:hypothetical protein
MPGDHLPASLKQAISNCLFFTVAYIPVDTSQSAVIQAETFSALPETQLSSFTTHKSIEHGGSGKTKI